MTLCQEARAARRALTERPSVTSPVTLTAICDTIRKAVRSHLSAIEESRARRDALWNGSAHEYSWRTLGADALAAFNEGAGITV